jgi:CSLREA domain-containing protein
MRKYGLAVTGLALALCLVAPLGTVRGAQPDYWVNSTADPGTGTCNLTECTFREAIQAANSHTGSDIIAFKIPGTDPGCNDVACTITLASDLPTIRDNTGGTMINAFTQVDTINPNGPEIVINGSSTYRCFDLRSAYNTIKGLVINQCLYDGIRIVDSGAHHNTVIANYIGINAQGTAASGNTHAGIYIGYASDNTIGGSTSTTRNIISGNGHEGVFIYGDGADRNVLSGNYIGTDSSGVLDVGNTYDGIYVDGGAEDNEIGPDNIIAHNQMHGVSISASATMSNTVTQNSIHSSLWQGISLSGGANGGILAPDVSSSSSAFISGTAPTNATVELFTGPDDEGKMYLTTVSADGDGNWSVVSPFTLDTYVTATATDAGGNTSAFSAPSTPGTCYLAYVPLGMKRY